MSYLTIAGHTIKAGSRRVIRVPVTEDLAMSIDIHAHVVAGASPGPTLLLLSMLHGNEWFSVIILRELLKRIDPQALTGNVIAIPVANTAAFMTGTRCNLDDSDEPDANRTFGSIYEWTTNQLTRVIANQFFPHTDHIIDYHVSDWGSAMADISYTEDYWRVSPKKGGYLEPTVGLDRQFTEVAEGELLGSGQE